MNEEVKLPEGVKMVTTITCPTSEVRKEFIKSLIEQGYKKITNSEYWNANKRIYVKLRIKKKTEQVYTKTEFLDAN